MGCPEEVYFLTSNCISQDAPGRYELMLDMEKEEYTEYYEKECGLALYPLLKILFR